jgi:hypothetical protein
MAKQIKQIAIEAELYDQLRIKAAIARMSAPQLLNQILEQILIENEGNNSTSN